MAAKKAQPRPKTRLYLITPPQISLSAFTDTLGEALSGGDVACLQLRLKKPDGSAAPHTDIEAAIGALMPLCHAANVAFILNDDPALAHQHGCDGVHIGQSDMAYAAARKLIGDDAIIGVTCHDNKHLALEAGEAGADYVAFGAFYETQTKATSTRPDAEILRFWQQFVELPCVAIGGITPDNAAPLVEAGADFIAASGSVWQHKQGPREAVRQFNALFDDLFEDGAKTA